MTEATNSSSDRWLDVCTTAIPRTTVRKCLTSFLNNWTDRKQYKVRWLVHLDHYEGLENHYRETLTQIADVAPRFDAAEVVAPKDNVKFGGAAWALFQRVRSDALWIEDDWLWVKPWSLTEVEAVMGDACWFSFVSAKTVVGAMHPSFWRVGLCDFLRAHFPKPLEMVHELTIAGTCRGYGGRMATDPRLWSCCRHIGNDRLRELGFTHNHVGQRLDERYHKPHWDAAKKEWVKR